MPEEINRVVTDALADLLLTPSADGNENLAAEGIADTKIHLVGNVMIDSLIRLLPMTELERLCRKDGSGSLRVGHAASSVERGRSRHPAYRYRG